MVRAIRLFSFVGFLSAASVYAATPGITVDLKPDSTKIVFTAVGRPSALKIKGEGAKASGQLTALNEALTGEITTDLKDFQTGIALRDHHMKEKYLEVDKPGFSSAVLKIVSFSLPKGFFDKSSETQSDFTGKLRLHGVEKDVKGTASTKYRPESGDLSGTATFKVALADFGIDVPKFAGITVAQDVDVEAEFLGTVKKTTTK
jgi:polyisoprenoid-binding protein YceI